MSEEHYRKYLHGVMPILILPLPDGSFSVGEAYHPFRYHGTLSAEALPAFLSAYYERQYAEVALRAQTPRPAFGSSPPIDLDFDLDLNF